MKTVQLAWCGPMGLETVEERAAFTPPESAGVYFWGVGPRSHPRLCYVGQAQNLAERIYQHIFWTLGGAYCLYSDKYLHGGESPELVYMPGLRNVLDLFLGDYAAHTQLALKNVLLNWYFWALVPEEEAVRLAVESGITIQAKARGEAKLTERIGRAEARSVRCKIISTFQSGVEVAGLPEEIEYGMIE